MSKVHNLRKGRHIWVGLAYAKLIMWFPSLKQPLYYWRTNKYLIEFPLVLTLIFRNRPSHISGIAY